MSARRQLLDASGWRCVAAVLSFASVLAPYVVFRLSGDSSFFTFWEFASNRYFQALNVLAQDDGSIWVVQGIPMAIFQAWIMRILQWVEADRLAQPSQLELFSQITVLMGYAFTAAVIAGSWWIKSLRITDRLTMLLVMLALFPVTRWYNYFFAPDYWINEVPFYVFSAFWTISILRRHLSFELRPPGAATLVFAGLWIAVCFAQKPSLAGFGSLPIVLHLCLATGNAFGFVLRAGLCATAAVVGHICVMGALFNFRFAPTQSFITTFWRWLLGSPGAGTSHVDLRAFLALEHALNYPIYIASILLLITAVLCIIEKRRRALAAFGVASICMAAIAIGHGFVLYLRPSGTSVIDLALFANATIPLCLAFLSHRGDALPAPHVATLGIAQAIAIALVLLFSFYPAPPRGYRVSLSPVTQNDLLAAIKAEADYVRGLERPAVVVIGDNRSQPRTIEALALYTGQLGLMASERAPEASSPPAVPVSNQFRQRILGNTVIVSSPTQQDDFLRSAIAAGHAVIWGSFDNVPQTEDLFPQLRELKQRPDVIMRSFLMETGGNRTAHVAFIDVAVTRPRAPINVIAERISADEVRLSWAETSSPNFNRIQLGVGNQPLREIAVTINQRSYVVRGLPASASYRFRVLAQAGVLVSDPSDEVIVKSAH